MAIQKPQVATNRKPVRSLAVRRAAAKTAVAASEKTGRPVDPRVKELAESADGDHPCGKSRRQAEDGTASWTE